MWVTSDTHDTPRQQRREHKVHAPELPHAQTIDSRYRPFFDQIATIPDFLANVRWVALAQPGVAFASGSQELFQHDPDHRKYSDTIITRRKRSLPQRLARKTAHRISRPNIISSAKDLASETCWPSLKRDCATKLNECSLTSLRE